MSEGWRAELKSKNIGVSVLCPALVNTNILDSYRNRPDSYGGARPLDDARRAQVRQMMDQGGMPANVVAMAVLEAVKDDTLYIIPHPEYRTVVEPRLAAIERGFDRAEKSPALNGAPAAPGGSTRGKTVFITGAASGIGLPVWRKLCEGANVMIADVQADAIPRAPRHAARQADPCRGRCLRRDEPRPVRAAALETIVKFGKVHYVCNNAGVAVSADRAHERVLEWIGRTR